MCCLGLTGGYTVIQLYTTLKYTILLKAVIGTMNQPLGFLCVYFKSEQDLCVLFSQLFEIPSSKLTWPQKGGTRSEDGVKMYLLLKMGDFNCHVSSPEGMWLAKRVL